LFSESGELLAILITFVVLVVVTVSVGIAAGRRRR